MVFRAALPLAFALVSLTAAHAGPLNPPPGPVSPTHKTLTQVEPRTPVSAATTPGDADSVFRIAQPGSYYLTGNVQGVAAKGGIEIAASGVTLDLGGFAVLGVAGSASGVFAVVGPIGINLCNGTVSGWGGSAVELQATGGTLIEGIIAHSNGGVGIRSGTAGVVRFCTASGNGGTGIIGFNDTIVESCLSHGNGNNGFSLGPGAQARGCVARVNSTDGIDCLSQAVVTDCGVHSNGGVGIDAGELALVERCVSSGNGGDGIRAALACIIRSNSCTSNGASPAGGSGIHVTAGGCRIEGNHCTTADRGIEIDAADTVVLRNTCGGNAVNWEIAAGNAVASIVAATTNAAAIVGDAYAGGLGSADPNANVTF